MKLFVFLSLLLFFSPQSFADEDTHHLAEQLDGLGKASQGPNTKKDCCDLSEPTPEKTSKKESSVWLSPLFAETDIPAWGPECAEQNGDYSSGSYMPSLLGKKRSFSGSSYVIEPIPSPNSALILKGTMSARATYASVEILHKQTKRKVQTLHAIKNCSLDLKLYLRFGPGDYEIKIGTHGGSSAYSHGYYNDITLDIKNLDTRNLEHILPTQKAQSDAPEIRALAQEITRNMQTDAEKTLAIYDWITSNIAYDTVNFSNGNYRNINYDALYSLQTRTVVCEGYANLLAALLRSIGIHTRVIYGNANASDQGVSSLDSSVNHAWNEVYIDGRWVVMDPTWDSGYLDSESKQFVRNPQRKYFDPHPGDFAKDHRRDHIAPN